MCVISLLVFKLTYKCRGCFFSSIPSCNFRNKHNTGLFI
ncbi:hypothetical protein PanWU01x14_132050 [Parasponia andersonii]|uniref:Uncharacterized protein n=1 Tax=Parasponia andersonii TaxID=3476 RepID=A0A2P5CQJ1_PARAD|nr:hypothetical protein PanWU01x14_132050 [Parasponia andersonii]